MGTHLGAVLLEQDATRVLARSAACAQFRIAKHVPDRHPGRFEAPQKFDPH